MDYEFSAKVNGFTGKLTGDKLVNVNDYESVDNLISDSLKILKASEATITYTIFTGYESKALLRIYRMFSNEDYSVITWDDWHNHTERKIKATRQEVKAAVLEAIEYYRWKAAELESAC
jgi:hypothetical protein